MSRFVRTFLTLLVAISIGPTTSVRLEAVPESKSKLEPLARARAAGGLGRTRVIVRASGRSALPHLRRLIEQAGGAAGRQLPLIDAQIASVPSAALNGLARNPHIAHIAIDRIVTGSMERTAKVVRATDARRDYGYTGKGIAVAVIDSGVDASPGDLGGAEGGGVVHFVDFVNGLSQPYDDFGHGTHVAGIIGGDGSRSNGARSGIAPGAKLVVLKVLDETGSGRISDVIAALDYVVANKDALNIKVVNLSLATGVHESYDTDPLALATKRAVATGIVVVASAGNIGRDPYGTAAYGGVTAPANAPWVLSVGASSHMGTDDRDDDTVALFSSRGPTAVTYTAKPDIVAPGVGIESSSAPGSTLFEKLSQFLLPGSSASDFPPYMSMSGTSMSAPVVSGTVALMLQANPSLTPNQVKAILQYTARSYADFDGLTQGAGFLNAKGAVVLARYFALSDASAWDGDYPSSSSWSGRIIWGNQSVRGGRLTPSATAWAPDVTWGAAVTPRGEPVGWGQICTLGGCDAAASWAPWSATCDDEACTSVTWGAGTSRNVVWGTTCGGADCAGPWTPLAAGSSLSTFGQAATVVWGSGDAGDTVVWGSTVVWGTRCDDPACVPVIWNRE